jgi:hydroxymethylpyrimidine/phosphomethylpyrimidine kinase
MLPTAAVVEAVAAAVEDLDIALLVVDPVMIAKGGARLIDDEAAAAMKTELLKHAFVVTPNIPEAEALSGLTIHTDTDRREAAKRIVALGASAVIVKGGHFGSGEIVDLLYDAHRFLEFRVDRVQGRSTHGTGCTFASRSVSRWRKPCRRRSAMSQARSATRRTSGAGTDRWIISGILQGVRTVRNVRSRSGLETRTT